MLTDRRREHRAKIVRAYPGADHRDAVRRFAADADALITNGYRVSAYEWRPMMRVAVRAPLPGVLAPPHGTLTVTYAATPKAAHLDLEAAASVAPAGAAAELIDLLGARAEGVISDDQFTAMRRRLVPRT